MFIAETMVSAVVGYILIAFFVSLLFFRGNWKNGEGREDINMAPCDTYTVQEQKHSSMRFSLMLGVVWPVSISVYLVCRGLGLLVEGMLYIAGKFVGVKTRGMTNE